MPGTQKSDLYEDIPEARRSNSAPAAGTPTARVVVPPPSVQRSASAPPPFLSPRPAGYTRHTYPRPSAPPRQSQSDAAIAPHSDRTPELRSQPTPVRPPRARMPLPPVRPPRPVTPLAPQPANPAVQTRPVRPPRPVTPLIPPPASPPPAEPIRPVRPPRRDLLQTAPLAAALMQPQIFVIFSSGQEQMESALRTALAVNLALAPQATATTLRR